MNFKIEQNEVPPEPEPVIGLRLTPGGNASVRLVATSNGKIRTLFIFENGSFRRAAHDPIVSMPGLKVDEHGRIKEAE
jgi:hypothetical protein